MQALNST